MKQFTFTIRDPVGIHARPAGRLAETVNKMDSTVRIATADGRSSPVKRIMSVMGLGIKQGDTVTVTVEGGNERANAILVEEFFKDNL